MNSYHAATGFGVLNDFLLQENWLAAADRLQNAFYKEGKSLSDAATYHDIAAEFGVDSPAFTEKITEVLSVDSSLHLDYQIVRSFGVSSYPTLILEKDGKFYDLRSGAMTAAELEKNFETIVNL